MIKLVVLGVIFIILLVIFLGLLFLPLILAYDDQPEICDGCPYFDVGWPGECCRKESED